MNLNAQVFSHPINLQESLKRQKIIPLLNVNSTVFKNNGERSQTQEQKAQDKQIQQLQLDKKLKKNSKPFNVPLPTPEPVLNKPFYSNTIIQNTLIPNENKNITPIETPQLFISSTNPLMIFSDSSSYPKLSNKKNLKSPIPATNSAIDLVPHQKEKNEIVDLKQKENYDKPGNQEKKPIFESETIEIKSLPPILEETPKIKEEKKKLELPSKYETLKELSHITKNEEIKQETPKIKHEVPKVKQQEIKISDAKVIDSIPNIEKPLTKIVSSPIIEKTEPIQKVEKLESSPIIQQISKEKVETVTKVDNAPKEEVNEKVEFVQKNEKVDSTIKLQIPPKQAYKELILSMIQVIFFFLNN